MPVAFQSKTYVPRLIDQHLVDVLEAFAAVLISGPRATGKTTSARRHARTVVQLDRAVEAAARRTDPDSVLATFEELILIDGWQVVPEVLGAVKRLVDVDSRPNRFILTGSARSDAITDSWPATGRSIRLTEWPLTQPELAGRSTNTSLIDYIVDIHQSLAAIETDHLDIRDYIAMALTGGYPEVTALQTDRNRRLWLGSYVDQLVTRDASLIGSHRDPRRLRGYLQALAANSAGRVEHKTLYDADGITRNTALTYDELLELMMITEQVPAWSTNQLSRLGRSPKRYLTDPSLLAALLQLDGRGAMRNGDILGRQIDTFVLAQLRAELTVSNMSATLSHLRLDDGRRIMELESRLIAPGLNQVARFIRKENVESPTPKHLRLSRPP